MDYQEEQRNELEAIESIYSNELQVLSREPPLSFTIDIKTEPKVPSMIGDDTVGLDSLYATIKFTLPDNYPDKVPEIEIESSENLDDHRVVELTNFLKEQSEANKGMVMVFTLVTDALEWLNEKSDEIFADKREAKRKIDEEIEKEEMKRFEGTRVTVESFMAWRKKFEEEFLGKGKQKQKESGEKRLTGRELFEKDKSLYESDLTMLEEGEDDYVIDEIASGAVEIDEDLFQDMDDLDLNDLQDKEDSDDPDYQPQKSSNKKANPGKKSKSKS